MYEQTEVGYKLYKSDLYRLLDLLKEYGRVFAPQKNDNWLRFLELEDYKKLVFEGLTWYSPKEFLFPKKQIIFEFERNKIIKDNFEVEKKVLFGLRLCDLNSFFINDKLFLEQEPVNKNYKKHRENLTLVGLWCDSQVDNFCFCSSLKLKNYYDLCLFDRGDFFHIKFATEKGYEIISKLGLEKDENYTKSVPECRNKLMTTDIQRFFNRDDMWQTGADKCLSCGDCTSLCPTCLCFDIKDEMNIDLKSGKRILELDSCMFRDFSLVAGGHAFREKRVNRFKHRFFHKLVYFPKKFSGESMCTGCGRCIRGCPTKIHWVCKINGLVIEEKKGGSPHEHKDICIMEIKNDK